MNFIKSILRYLNSIGESRNVMTTQSTRRYIEDVKPGEDIRIEWHRIQGGIGYLKCLNNDPITSKIFLQVTWAKEADEEKNKKEQIILDYGSEELKNFHLLNQDIKISDTTDDDDSDDISILQKRMNEAIDKEEYEKAEELQNKINNIIKKSK